MKSKKIRAALLVLSIGMMMGIASPSKGNNAVTSNNMIVAHAETVYMDDPISSLAITKGSNSSYTGYFSAETGLVTWQLVGNATLGNYVKIGGKFTSDSKSIYTSTPVLGKIGKIVLTHPSKDSEVTVNSIVVTAHTSAADAESGNNAVITASGSYNSSNPTSITFEPTENLSLYYRVTYNLSSSNSSKNKGICLSNIDLYQVNESAGDAYKVSFGNADGSTYVNEGEKLQQPTDPKKDGFSFAGWYVDEKLSTPVIFPMDVTEDTTIYAKWTDLDLTSIGSLQSNTIARVRGKVTAITASSTAFIQNGIYGTQVYIGDGLPAAFKVGNIVEFTSNVTTNAGALQVGGTIYGDVKVSTQENPLVIDEVITITNLNDVTSDNSGRYVELKNLKLKTAYSNKSNLNMNIDGSSIILYVKDYNTLTGNNGSYVVGDYVDVKGAILQYNDKVEICLTEIKHSTTYNVSFNANNGSAIITTKVGEGDKITRPADPKKDATALEIYEFDGWYDNKELEGEPYDFNSEITGDVTLYAKWNVQKVSISETFGEAKTYVGLNFDYDIKTKYSNKESYISADLVNLGSSEEFLSNGSLNNGTTYKLSSDGAYFLYKIQDSTLPLSVKVKAYATGTGTLSGYHFVTLDEDKQPIRELDAETFNDNESKEKTLHLEHTGSAVYVGIVCDKVSGSNVFVEEFSIGTNKTVSYENFRNVTLSFSYAFDVSAANDVAEVGIYYTTSANATFTDGTDALPEGGTKVVNEAKVADFTATINIEDVVEAYNTSYDVVCYVKTTDGKYYYGEEKLYDIETILEAYSNLDGMSEKDLSILEAFEDSIFEEAAK